MLILAIESSAISASCALLREDHLVAEYFINNKLTHSVTLMPMIEQMLKTAQMEIKDIDLIAIANGPGSFTGIRIGIATVKGLAAPFNIPCMPVTTLEGIAFGTAYFEGVICCVMDARCNQVYNALFICENGMVTRFCEDRAILIEELESELSKLDKPVLMAGDGARLCMSTIKNSNHLQIAPENLCFQHAFGVALAAKKLYNNEKLVNANELLPFYLRLPQAQRERQNKQI